MSKCVNCGAPLPANDIQCHYCGSRNDTDLKGVHPCTVHEPRSRRPCPRCTIAMETIDLKLNERFYIERCPQCMGLFFDPGELELLLEASVKHVFHIDRKKLDRINRVMGPPDSQIRYVKCPVCAQIMNRTSFGTRSGVIVDRCAAHGIWLDGGELRHLFEWMKAGGMRLHRERQKTEEPQRKTNPQAVQNRNQAHRHNAFTVYDDDRSTPGTMDLLDILQGVTRWFMK